MIKPLIIGISGGTGSGKSRFAKELIKRCVEKSYIYEQLGKFDLAKDVISKFHNHESFNNQSMLRTALSCYCNNDR